jgi:uncharacterized 2Fe-2S/4Fe-4S cluster protein (DUF4445 family)
MRHFKVTFQPDGKNITIHAGATLLEAANAAGIILNAVCGGKGTCGKCEVLVEPDKTPVLACQKQIDGDITVTVPDTSRFFEQKILEHGIDIQIEPTILKPGDTSEATLGLAVDIGTTTVVARLISLADGRIIATESDFNPQAAYGDDVISRITFAQTAEKLEELQRLIIESINTLIQRLCEKSGTDSNHICEMTVVGNTTMNHIFLNLPIAQLGHAPYKAYSLEARDLTASELRININPEANVHTVENIAGFVGSDTVAAALATGVDLAEELTLLIDIGTNGELVCGNKEKLFAASCAAGPALEGARISRGSRAVNGAIEAVFVNDNGDDIDVDLIGDGPAKSICGSGLIDAAAVMLDLNLLDYTGRISSPDTLSDSAPSAISKRIIVENDQPAFVLAYKKDGSPSVVLTQKDIRELQLAKAAIAAGIKMLLQKLAIEASDIQKLLLAGAFGNYINKTSALRIGLLPNLPLERIHFVGNAAGSGARMILINTQARELAGRLARKIRYVEIAHEPAFADIYTDSMFF